MSATQKRAVREALAENLEWQARKAGCDPVEIWVDRADLQIILTALSAPEQAASAVSEAERAVEDCAERLRLLTQQLKDRDLSGVDPELLAEARAALDRLSAPRAPSSGDAA